MFLFFTAFGIFMVLVGIFVFGLCCGVKMTVKLDSELTELSKRDRRG